MLRLKQRIKEGRIHQDETDRQVVRLILEDGTHYPQEGSLQFSDVTVDPSTGSVILRMVFPNPEATLLPGMFVRAILNEGINAKAILIPQQSVSRDHKGNPVALIVNSENKVEQRMLNLDRAIDDKWLVASGLNPKDRVIVEGTMMLRPGTPVKPIPFKGPENKSGTQAPGAHKEGGA